MTITHQFRRRCVAVAFTAGLALMAVTGPSTAQDASGDAVVATVNGETITERDLNAAAHEFSDQLQQMPGDPRENLIDLLVNMRLAAAAATAGGLDKDPDVMAQLSLVKNRALYLAYIRSKVGDVMTEEAAHKRFDEEMAKFVPGDEIHVQHILVDSEDEANAIIAQLDAGGDFSAIAKEKSKDPGSAPNGGDLGFIKRGETVKQFEDAAFTLDIGQYTKTPVQSQYGWHVIKVEEKRPETPPTFDQEARRIQQDLFGEAFDKMIADLRETAKIEVVPPPPAAGRRGTSRTGEALTQATRAATTP